MGWINPLCEEHQCKRWLRNDAHLWVRHDAYRFTKHSAAEAKSHEACSDADEAMAAADWEATRERLRQLSWAVKDLRNYFALRRLRVKSNPDVENQPRDKLGRWTDTGRARDKGNADDAPNPEMVTRPAFFRGPIPSSRLPLGTPPGMNPQAHELIESQLSKYNWLSNFNRSDLRAVFRFNAAAFEPGAILERNHVSTGVLTRDEVKEACPRYWEVQETTNAAAIVKDRGAFATPQAWGTAVHTWIRDEINGPLTDPPSPPRDPDFRSELSVIKGQEANRYGEPGSKRVDVYENPHTGTVCIYDIKTGEAGLSFARMRELATNVGKYYPGTKQIVVTEVRPFR